MAQITGACPKAKVTEEGGAGMKNFLSEYGYPLTIGCFVVEAYIAIWLLS